jgi:hypothetical protein
LPGARRKAPDNRQPPKPIHHLVPRYFATAINCHLAQNACKRTLGCAYARVLRLATRRDYLFYGLGAFALLYIIWLFVWMIEPEHLLFGLIREDKHISLQFISPATNCSQSGSRLKGAKYHAEQLSTSADLPLSEASKSVLACAEKERVLMEMAALEPVHVLLGLLQHESLAARALHERSVKVQSVRGQFERPVVRKDNMSGEKSDDVHRLLPKQSCESDVRRYVVPLSANRRSRGCPY